MNISSLIEVKSNPDIPDLNPGDTVKVRTKIVEGEKERIQLFQGTIIRVRHGGAGASFTVRHVAYGIGVERTFPFLSPMVEKVEVVRHGKVRRARLYYLRSLSGKASRIKERRVEKEELAQEAAAQQPEAPAEAQAAQEAPVQPPPVMEPPAEQKAPESTGQPPNQEPRA